MYQRSMTSQIFFCAICLALFILPGCSLALEGDFKVDNRSVTIVFTATPQQIKTIEPTLQRQTPIPSEVMTKATKEHSINLTCMRPSEDYSRIEINGHKLNQRTFEMLQTAQILYGGIIDITGNGITQGSYTNAVEASFGTHAGGGAVDLSVMAPDTYTILYEDIEPLIKALRSAGFAAWYRDLDDLYDGSPAHIHAIAIGDRELSLAAREQLAGPFGYFWGYNGLPTRDKNPIRDAHGGPILCDWMLKKGYPDKTATPSPDEKIP
ncbi:MAG: hypothetical protein SVP52_09760 [Chloroflexota bacterium]|nr:hypothetical protein [Chloroflexota bacterium]